MNSKRILSVTKKIIRKAAEVGLDHAGTLILGGAWPYFKKILSPVVEDLERRYPKMLLVGDALAIPDSEKALKALTKEPRFQEMLENGFSKLKDGQGDILRELDRIDAILQEIGESIDHLSDMTEDGFKDVLKALKTARSSRSELEEQTPADFVDELLRGVDVTPKIAKLARFSGSKAQFIKEVLDDGKPNTTYRRELKGLIKNNDFIPEPTEYMVRVSEIFRDELNRQCREVEVQWHADDKWEKETWTFFQERGKWEGAGIKRK